MTTQHPDSGLRDRPGPPGSPLAELRYALAQADTDQPPTALRSRVLDAATSARLPGLAIGTAAAISPVEAYRRTMVSFDSVLSTLTDAEWHRHVLRDLDIQGLVGHLIGVERQLHAALGMTARTIGSDTDHVASTQADALAQAGRAPSDTHAEWRDLLAQTVAYIADLGPKERQRPVTLHTFTVPVERMLVVRSFETWTHEEDIRRATGRPLEAPDSARLRLMTELAVSALPWGLELIDRPQPGRTARVVLTGPGGGTWQAALGGGAAGPSDVRVVADAVLFCRLAANRVDPVDVAADISGDDALGADLLAAVQALALD